MIIRQRTLGAAMLSTLVVTSALVVSGASAVHAATAEPPTVKRLSPATGPVGGGTKVTVKGTGFTDVTKVLFGAKAGTSLTVKSATKLNVTSPAHSGGNVDVEVVTGSGSSTANPDDLFNYIPRPLITSISPDRGDTSGDVYVLVNGKHLVDVQSVTVGGHQATWKMQPADNRLTPVLLVQVPPGRAGATQIVVRTLYGTSRRTSHSEYHYATSTWTHTNTTPPGSGAGTAEFNAAECSATRCYAVGESGSKITANDLTPLVDVQSPGGKWRKATVQPPQGFGGFTDAVLSNVSCSRNHLCAALGTDATASTHGPRPLLAVGSGRHWAAYYPPMPTDWSRSGDWEINDIACRQLNCVAIGWYVASRYDMKLLVETFASGTWTLRDPSDQGQFDPDVFDSRNENSAVTCPSASECLDVTGLGTQDAVAVHIPLLGDDPATVESLPWESNGGDTIRMDGISCTSAAWCVAYGVQYEAADSGESPAEGFTYSYEVYADGTWTQHGIPLVSGSSPPAVIQPLGIDCATTGTCYLIGQMIGDEEGGRVPPAWPPRSGTVTRINASGASTIVPEVPDRYLGLSSWSTVDCAYGPTCQTYGGSSDVVRGHEVGESFTTRLGAPQRPMYVTYPQLPHSELARAAFACRAADDCIIAGAVHIADGSDHGQGHNRLYLLRN